MWSMSVEMVNARAATAERDESYKILMLYSVCCKNMKRCYANNAIQIRVLFSDYHAKRCLQLHFKDISILYNPSNNSHRDVWTEIPTTSFGCSNGLSPSN